MFFVGSISLPRHLLYCYRARKIEFIHNHIISRDDILTELAKTYNQAFEPDEAIKTLMFHDFVPCEGGEHAIADQYMFTYIVNRKK